MDAWSTLLAFPAVGAFYPRVALRQRKSSVISSDQLKLAHVRSSEVKGAVMKEVSLEEAQLHLAEIIAAMSPGSEVAIVAGSKAIATIRSTELVQASAPRQLGTLKGSVSYIAPDFDAIPQGFEEALG